jgi:membrane protease YdiL (CAAX protease family)
MDDVAKQGLQSKRRSLFLGYALIAYLLSWAIEIPLALRAQGVISVDIPFAIHYLVAFGPFVAGVVLTWREGRATGLKNLLKRMIKWRVQAVWWIVAISPLLLFFIVALGTRLVQGTWMEVGALGRVDFLPDLGIGSVFLWLVTFGLGEETGWRGYLLPRLQRDNSAWSATIILWVIWAIWHVPSFYYLHTVTGGGTLVGFLLGVLAGSIFLTWLYNSTGGSVLIVAVWHGLFDYVTACTDCKSGLIAATVSTLVMVWAVVVVLIFKPKNLSRLPKNCVF